MSFTHHHFFRLLVVLVPIVFVVSSNSAAPIEEPNLSLQGFPTSEFFGGISVDLDGLEFIFNRPMASFVVRSSKLKQDHS